MKNSRISILAFTGALLFTTSLFAADTATTAADNSTADTSTQYSNSPHQSLREQMFQLQQRVNNLYAHKKKGGVNTQFGDHLNISGGINVQAAFSKQNSPTAFTGPGNETMDLNTAYLNFNAMLTSWMRTFLSLTYEPGTIDTSTGGASTGPEVEQAYVQFAKARNTHFHLDIGKQYMPFGVYERYPVVDSLTQSLAEIDKVGAVAGVSYDPFFASAYIFNMQGTLGGFGSTAASELDNGGGEVGLMQQSKDFGYEASLGYLNNMAETRFIYGVIKATNRAIGEFAGHLSFNIYRLGFISNIAYAAEHFDSRDITFNGKGAQPYAWETELNYTFEINGHPLVPAIGYERSEQALFLSLAHYRYVASLEYTFNRYLTGTLELLRAKNYASTDTGAYATGVSSTTTITGNNAWNNAGIVEIAANF